MANCWPWFSTKYRALDAEPWSKTVLRAGADAGANGDIPVKPDDLRARAEAQLAQVAPQALAMIGGRLTLEMYTFARYMATESLGNRSTVEERVAVGEALRNRSKMGRTIYQLLTPSGFYGPIHAPDAYCESIGKDCTGKHNVCCAPFNRWAATTQDPSVMTVILAALVLSGATNDFAQGADDQAAVHTEAWVRYLAKNGKFWVGPLPGVDHYNTFLTFTPSTVTRAAQGQDLLDRALAVLGKKPVWPPMTEICAGSAALTTSANGAEIVLALLGLAAGAAGAFYFNRWLAAGEPV